MELSRAMACATSPAATRAPGFADSNVS
jgi:hypothetical protein